MAKCPFFSYPKITRLDVEEVASSGSISSGTPTDVAWSASLGMTTPGHSIDVVYATDDLVKVDCLESNCEIWDADNSRCGMLTSNLLHKPGNSDFGIIEQLLDFRDTIGKIANKDDGMNLFEYLKNVFGKGSEKDSDKSLIQFLQSMFGTLSERDAGQSLIVFLQSMFGITSERDSAKSLIMLLQNVLGQTSELDEFGSILELQQHFNTEHWDKTSGDAIPKAVALVSEYMGGEDMDGNGKIYGKDFHIDPDDPAKPPMLANMPNEGLAVTWADYLIEIS